MVVNLSIKQIFVGMLSEINGQSAQKLIFRRSFWVLGKEKRLVFQNRDTSRIFSNK